MFDLPNAEMRSLATKEQMILHNELWEVIERHVGRWESDESLDDKMIAAVLMATGVTFVGEMMAMVVNAMGMPEEALSRGADMIRNGALATASHAIKALEEEDKEEARHRRLEMFMSNWQPIETAPRDGTRIFGLREQPDGQKEEEVLPVWQKDSHQN